MKLTTVLSWVRQRWVKFRIGWRYSPNIRLSCFNCVAFKVKSICCGYDFCDRFKFPTLGVYTCRHYAPQKYITSPDHSATTLLETLGKFDALVSDIEMCGK